GGLDRERAAALPLARLRLRPVDRSVAFEERKMFGGLTFIVNTHMACGIVKDDLMVRVGKDGHVAALARGAHVMDFTGRPMRGRAGQRAGDAFRDALEDGWRAMRRATTKDLARLKPDVAVAA
ncbi:MAG TPA: TfoX/Sxy family protein, partial [Pseudonocardiaceae bacterium]|nr:TfoX/Sxy family protein [Pseudonocardiaceae bacterium]